MKSPGRSNKRLLASSQTRRSRFTLTVTSSTCSVSRVRRGSRETRFARDEVAQKLNAMRDAVANIALTAGKGRELYAGTNEIMKVIVAKQLGL